MALKAESLKLIEKMQQGELDESVIYTKIAACIKKENDKEILKALAAEEAEHAEIWKQYTGKELKPNKIKVLFVIMLAKVFGYTFALKRMENGEHKASNAYKDLCEDVPEAMQIAADEERHEQELLSILDEDRLKYVRSMVLGLNDALVELTGTIAGLTFAFQDTKLVALSGLITGVAATLSMASSEFLSARSEGRTDAFKSCLYTGSAYVSTVILLVLPYLLFGPGLHFAALGTMIGVAMIIILVFNYYIAVAKSEKFFKRFVEMAVISLGVAAVSFAIGVMLNKLFGI